MIGRDLKISRRVVRELSCRFVEKNCGFQIWSEVVSFTLIDVCIGIGLRVTGEKVDLEKESSDSQLRSLFGSNCVIVTMIYEELIKRVNDCIVVDFCKLYILLDFSEFLLSNTKRTVYSGLFSLVDNQFGELCKYKWGGIVYEYSVTSLCEVASSIQNETVSSYVYIVGCTYLLQVVSIVSSKVKYLFVNNCYFVDVLLSIVSYIWACEHLLFPNKNGRNEG